MPNRVIKDSVRTSRSLARLTDRAERLFHRLRLTADDFGRFEADLDLVLAACFPRHATGGEGVERWSTGDIEGEMRELQAEKMVEIYTGEEGRLYGVFVNWERYERRRAKFSKYPDPPKLSTLGGTYPHSETDRLNSIHTPTSGDDMTGKRQQLTTDDSTCQHVTTDDSTCWQMPADDSGQPLPFNTEQAKLLGDLSANICQQMPADASTCGQMSSRSEKREARSENRNREARIEKRDARETFGEGAERILRNLEAADSVRAESLVPGVMAVRAGGGVAADYPEPIRLKAVFSVLSSLWTRKGTAEHWGSYFARAIETELTAQTIKAREDEEEERKRADRVDALRDRAERADN